MNQKHSDQLLIDIVAFIKRQFAFSNSIFSIIILLSLAVHFTLKT